MTPRWTVPELENIESAKGLPAYIVRRLQSALGVMKQRYYRQDDVESYSSSDYSVEEGVNKGLVLSIMCMSHPNLSMRNKDGSPMETLKIRVSSGKLSLINISYSLSSRQIDERPDVVEVALRNLVNVVGEICEEEEGPVPWD